jgi:hypothetical protein
MDQPNNLHEGYDIGVKTASEVDNLDSKVDKKEVKSLLRLLKKEYPDLEFPLAFNPGNGGLKVRVKSFDLDSWKKKNWSSKSILLTTGLGSVGKKSGSMNATDWEAVIAACYNMLSQGVSLEKAVALADTKWLDKYNSYVNDGKQIVLNSWKSPKGVMKHYGAGTTEVTSEWDEHFKRIVGKPASAMTRTPKTDLYLGKQKISVKKEGGSQLMSGGAPETVATLAYAYSQMPKSVKVRGFSGTYKKLMAQIEKEFGTIDVGKNKGMLDIKREMRAGRKDSLTRKVTEKLDIHKSMQAAAIELLSRPLVKEAVVREALTGEGKFGGSLASANYLLVFNPETKKSSYKKINSKLVKQIARSVNFAVNFKSAGGGGKPYSNFRMGVTEGFITDAMKKIKSSISKIFAKSTATLFDLTQQLGKLKAGSPNVYFTV